MPRTVCVTPPWASVSRRRESGSMDGSGPVGLSAAHWNPQSLSLHPVGGDGGIPFPPGAASRLKHRTHPRCTQSGNLCSWKNGDKATLARIRKVSTETEQSFHPMSHFSAKALCPGSASFPVAGGSPLPAAGKDTWDSPPHPTPPHSVPAPPGISPLLPVLGVAQEGPGLSTTLEPAGRASEPGLSAPTLAPPASPASTPSLPAVSAPGFRSWAVPGLRGSLMGLGSPRALEAGHDPGRANQDRVRRGQGPGQAAATRSRCSHFLPPLGRACRRPGRPRGPVPRRPRESGSSCARGLFSCVLIVRLGPFQRLGQLAGFAQCSRAHWPFVHRLAGSP